MAPVIQESTAEAFANRDEAVSILAPTLTTSEDECSAAEHSERSSQPTELREKLHNARHRSGGKEDGGTGSIQDRLFAKLLQQVIPSEDIDQYAGAKGERGAAKNITRPGFSLPIMTSNFRRFNARIGIVFVFQNRLIRLLSWRRPTHTLSFLAIYSFLCLDPHLLVILPLIIVLLFMMVPSFIARHPPPPSRLTTDAYSAAGPPVAPPPHVKPVSEMSKDFFRNMRDLQNVMEDFSEAHDTIVDLLSPLTNFSDETLSSGLFLLLSALACFLFVASHLLPWRLIFLVTGWALTCLGHPSVQRSAISAHKSHVRPHERAAKTHLTSWINSDIIHDSPPQIREVEIFELQRRNGTGDEWDDWLFSPSPFDPLSRPRVAGERPGGTRFFEDVQAPAGWSWSDKKWMLDLHSQEWVEERMITGVMIEMEGQRWVYDIDYDRPSGEDEDDDESETKDDTLGERAGSKFQAEPKRKDWEEGNGKERQGQWRRRRWARLVERRSEIESPDDIVAKT